MTNKPPDKPPRAVFAEYDSGYVVHRTADKSVVNGAIILFPDEHRDLIPVVEALGFKLKADALRLMWEQIDKDKADMKHNDKQSEDTG